MNKKSGFTLAEVLVTLMIIGVIAAMTIPSLMQSTAQQEYKAALKKAMSMLNQAVTMNYALDGIDASDPDYTGTNFFNLLTKRLNVMSTVSSVNGIYTADGMFFKVTGAGAKKCENNLDPDALTKSDNKCSAVEIDVNGMKGPNRPTVATNKVYDIFTLAIYPQKVIPDNTVTSEVLYMK